MQVKLDKDITPSDDVDPVIAAINAERVRILTELLKNSMPMVEEYRALLRHTGGLVTASMVYAYSKGINDTIKLLTKGYKNENVQEEK